MNAQHYPAPSPPTGGGDPGNDKLQGGESQNGGEPRPLRARIWSHRKTALETLVALGALIGSVTGTIAWLDSRDVPLNLTAATSQGYVVSAAQIAPQDLGLAIVNRSSHAVSLLDNGQVFVKKQQVGHVAALAVGGSSDSDVAGVAATFPYTIQSGSSSNVRLKWVPSAHATSLLRRAAQGGHRPNLRLVLRFDPGGLKEVTVKGGRLPQQFFGWRPFLTVSSNRVTGVDLAAADVATGSAVVTLRLWRGSSNQRKPSLVMSRPVSMYLSPNFPLPRLPSGQYLYSFAADTTTVAVGNFQTPCRGKDGRYYATLCADGDARGTTPGPPLTY
jgi:hypothetical protein